MDNSRLFAGIVLLLVVALMMPLLSRIDSWYSAVSALNLRWDREQRQAGAAGVSLGQRQAAQSDFEQLVSSRPQRLLWAHLVLALAAVALSLTSAWRFDDLQWIGLWLALPIGVALLAIIGYGWSLANQASTRLAAISASLYGPAPPRVRVRSIQAAEDPT